MFSHCSKLKFEIKFENRGLKVGGEFVYYVVQNMNEFGRISQCGSLSTYNKQEKEGELPLGSYNCMCYDKNLVITRICSAI